MLNSTIFLRTSFIFRLFIRLWYAFLNFIGIVFNCKQKRIVHNATFTQKHSIVPYGFSYKPHIRFMQFNQIFKTSIFPMLQLYLLKINIFQSRRRRNLLLSRHPITITITISIQTNFSINNTSLQIKYMLQIPFFI